MKKSDDQNIAETFEKMIIEYQNKVKDIEKYYENSEKMPKVY